jgi:hypothetical protein
MWLALPVKCLGYFCPAGQWFISYMSTTFFPPFLPSHYHRLQYTMQVDDHPASDTGSDDDQPGTAYPVDWPDEELDVREMGLKSFIRRADWYKNQSGPDLPLIHLVLEGRYFGPEPTVFAYDWPETFQDTRRVGLNLLVDRAHLSNDEFPEHGRIVPYNIRRDYDSLIIVQDRLPFNKPMSVYAIPPRTMHLNSTNHLKHEIEYTCPVSFLLHWIFLVLI